MRSRAANLQSPIIRGLHSKSFASDPRVRESRLRDNLERLCSAGPMREPASCRAIGKSPVISFNLLLVSRRIFQIAVALVVFFGTLTPLANCFDTWDKGPAAAPANDTELHLSAWIVGAGFVLVMTKLMRYIPALRVGVKRIVCPRFIPTLSIPALDGYPEPTDSPPLVALRI